MSTPSHLKPLLFFFLIHYTLQSPTNDQSNDPSVGAGTLALPLALHAKRIHEQRSYPTEPSTHSSTLVDQMPATPAANNRVETLFPSTTEVNEPTTQSPMMVWSRKIKSRFFGENGRRWLCLRELKVEFGLEVLNCWKNLKT